MKKSLLIISIILISLATFSNKTIRIRFLKNLTDLSFIFAQKKPMGSPISIVKTDSVFNLHYRA